MRRSLILGATCLLFVVVVGLEIPFGIAVARRLNRTGIFWGP